MNAESATLKVPLGLRDGTLVEPSAVPNGKACGCTCPGCGRALIAYNQGKVRTTSYFGHFPGDDCGHGYESAIHLAAKQAVVNARHLFVPQLLVGVDSPFREVKPRLVEPATVAHYDCVELEVTVHVEEQGASSQQMGLFEAHQGIGARFIALRPDVKAQRGEVTDWIEVRVTHAVDERKRDLLRRAGLRVLEIDLSGLPATGLNLDEIRRFTIERVDNKAWIAHPGLEEAKAAHAADLQRHVERVSRERAAAQRIAAKPPRVWLDDGERRPSMAAPEPISTSSGAIDEASLLAGLRRELRLGPSEKWPVHLDLALRGNGGPLVKPRIWLSRLFLDWISGQGGARYLVSDLCGAVRARFGVKPKWGAQDLRTALEQQVLPCWEAGGFVSVVNQVVTVTKREDVSVPKSRW